MFENLRRVVTGHDAQGKSIVAFDGPPGATIETARGAGFGEIWITDSTPADNTTTADTARRPVRLEPPAGHRARRSWLVMGTLEEVLWRGVYLELFPRSARWGVVWPSVFFALWHFAPDSAAIAPDGTAAPRRAARAWRLRSTPECW
jgi:hypothetical protein